MRSGRRHRVLVSLFVVGGALSWTLAGLTTAGAVPTGAPSDGPGVAAAAAAGGPSSSTPADDRLIVTVAAGTSTEQAQVIASEVGATLEARAGDTLILNPIAPTPDTLSAASAHLSTLPMVQSVEPNTTVHAATVPNDPLYPDQYGLADAQPGGIRAESAWNDTPGSRGVVVGVLDSGVQSNHPDLIANMWTNRTGINGCGYGTHGWDTFAHTCTPNDDEGHGTHVAGILGATGNNAQGVTGVAQRVSIMNIKMLDSQGGGTVANAVEGIDFALSAKLSGVNLRVLQASWGSSIASVAIHDAIARANDFGVLFVTAAGNGLDNNGVPANLDVAGNDEFPCEDSNPNVICVAASTPTGQLAAFSNYGANAVDLAAPGFRIQSTVPRNLVPGCDANSDYCLFNGTSMATPMVSGAAVDILAAEPKLTVTDLRDRILGSVSPQSSLVGKLATNGRLDVCKAIPNCDGRPAIAPTRPNNVRALARDGKATLRWDAPDSNGNSFTVTGYEVQSPNGTTTLPLSARSSVITGLPNNTNASIRVRAIGSGAGPWYTKVVRPYAGGYEVEGGGTLTPIAVGGKKPSVPSDNPTFGFNAARGVAIAPEGTGGYIVDLFGGIHRFRIGLSSPLPPAPTGGPYWLGWDIARGITVGSNGGGYVIDGYGGMHAFGAGSAAPPGITRDGPYWSGYDIARGAVLSADGKGGYIVDGFGGIHRFRVGASSPQPPAPTGGPYWLGWDVVRGITLVPGSGGGWVIDEFGGIHPFAAGGSAPAGSPSAPYWPGQDRSRGVGL